jgi:FMN phosphatase YigB (HAD superfamily)
MKFIFDFDDVLFHNTKVLKPYMYARFEEAGIPRSIVEPYYNEIKKTSKFWLKDLLTHFSLKESLYEEILEESKNIVNLELIDMVKKLGKDNCYILSHGGEEYQLEKIKRAGIFPLFKEVIVIFDKKTKKIEEICERHQDEEVFFIDDKAHHFDGLDPIKCKNLKTILFDENGPEKLKAIIGQ